MMNELVKIYYSPFFVKKFKKLPSRIRKLAIKKEALFKENMATPILKTHKLQGKLHDYYAFSINREYRIMFAIEADGSVVFIDVGTHSIYQ